MRTFKLVPPTISILCGVLEGRANIDSFRLEEYISVLCLFDASVLSGAKQPPSVFPEEWIQCDLTQTELKASFYVRAESEIHRHTGIYAAPGLQFE